VQPVWLLIFGHLLKLSSIQPPIIFFLIIGMSLLGILMVGIHRADARILQGSSSGDSQILQTPPGTVFVVGEPRSPLQQTPVSFPTLSPTPTPSVALPGTVTPFALSPLTADYNLLAFVHAPTGVVAQPYVILTAFVATPGLSVEVRGFENLREFVCTGFPCALPLAGDSTVRVTAYNADGDASPEVIARVRVESTADGYLVFIDSVSHYTLFADSCAGIWKVKDDSGRTWSSFPDTPFDLNTNKTLYLLAARLIVNGVVDASDCPNGGVTGSRDYATPCGIERAREKMVEWQNQFDFTIWITSLEVGIPPRILKSLIEYESQFWPGNERYYLDEFGLGQINELGIDTLLRQKPEYYRSLCPTYLSDCSLPYTSLDPAAQRTVRNTILNSLDAECPTCEYGVDLHKANRQIPLIAELLRSNCRLMEFLRVPQRSHLMNYEDLWKLTLASYHSGFRCVQDAVIFTREEGETEDWETISKNFGCKGAKPYVDGFWGALLSFDAYLTDIDSVSLVQVAPTFIPTPTRIPPPAVILSTATVRVRVYLDANRNEQPEESELLDGIFVRLLLRSGETLSGVTLNGEAVFDMTGYPLGTDIIASLPGLYREQLFSLPEEGIVQIDFVFESPDIPEELP
jgi:hypothetical protein